jgi:hypothetical protein
MYDFRIEPADTPALYRELNAAADALTEGEPSRMYGWRRSICRHLCNAPFKAHRTAYKRRGGRSDPW